MHANLKCAPALLYIASLTKTEGYGICLSQPYTCSMQSFTANSLVLHFSFHLTFYDEIVTKGKKDKSYEGLN